MTKQQPSDTEMLAWLASECSLQQLEKIWIYSDPTLDGMRDAIRAAMGSSWREYMRSDAARDEKAAEEAE